MIKWWWRCRICSCRMCPERMILSCALFCQRLSFHVETFQLRQAILSRVLARRVLHIRFLSVIHTHSPIDEKRSVGVKDRRVVETWNSFFCPTMMTRVACVCDKTLLRLPSVSIFWKNSILLSFQSSRSLTPHFFRDKCEIWFEGMRDFLVIFLFVSNSKSLSMNQSTRFSNLSQTWNFHLISHQLRVVRWIVRKSFVRVRVLCYHSWEDRRKGEDRRKIRFIFNRSRTSRLHVHLRSFSHFICPRTQRGMIGDREQYWTYLFLVNRTATLWKLKEFVKFIALWKEKEGRFMITQQSKKQPIPWMSIFLSFLPIRTNKYLGVWCVRILCVDHVRMEQIKESIVSYPFTSCSSSSSPLRWCTQHGCTREASDACGNEWSSSLWFPIQHHMLLWYWLSLPILRNSVIVTNLSELFFTPAIEQYNHYNIYDMFWLSSLTKVCVQLFTIGDPCRESREGVNHPIPSV